ncbi:hypothetical protein N7499_007146 [Penicillium canescens]|uniref:Uncharacterized protein n=1 Tax=Penicillium canescens TaxID=5083 RepID=A0AAD6IEV5_PENCN|nr:uncharacterized protein N7446_002838 [Penicillium canescens]KAJ6044644.1 hypothetical protein N7460_005999 [Penicillium canescens]KAJ6056114.1 hypothetical protein N7444_005212 [Penicillium canescens]KAJ6075061.1 hypothetical protein N7446_002838 [Penicillium canescens]KAJ6082272.1 hypothetical protein N7499_007146 [Penicillium canescens]KAJ6175931.1 hypothetical protein N7485_002845 [Penicillium canescens]
MSAPTALRQPEVPGFQPENVSYDQGDEILIDAHASTDAINPVVESTDDSEMRIDEEGRPVFTPAKDVATAYRIETRKVPVPPHRMTPLKANWTKICPPLWNI